MQPKSHFQPSSKRGPTPATSSVTTGEQSLSYADFIVQSKNNPPAAPLKESSSKPSRSVDVVITQEHNRQPFVSTVATGGLETEKCARGNDGESEVIQKTEIPPEARTDPQEGSCPKTDAGVSLGPRPVGSGSSIIVSPRQVSSIELQHLNDFWCENNDMAGIKRSRAWSNSITCLSFAVFTVEKSLLLLSQSERKSHSQVCTQCPLGIW